MERRKERKKNRQGKSEKEAFLWRLLPPGLRRSVVNEHSYQHYFLSPYTQEGKGWTNRDGQTGTDEQGGTNGEKGKKEKNEGTSERTKERTRDKKEDRNEHAYLKSSSSPLASSLP